MQKNILLTGVGGQGILSVAFVICNAALEEGLNFKQAEVHGMAVRGGAVQSNLRISSEPIYSDLIPRGKCDLLLSVEPLEVLRYLDYLGPQSAVVTSVNPVVNIPNYPPMDEIWAQMDKIGDVTPIDADSLARQAGSPLAANMAMLGAGSVRLPLNLEGLEKWVVNLWKEKGDKVVDVNLKAFHAGRKMSQFLRACENASASRDGIRVLTSHVPFESADSADAEKWVEFLNETPSDKWVEAISARV
ncbi:MAG TPA: indolepyruvate oxidoreductase subunit beta [Firmicutes bacterium]|nr:indolepyruvate oxidoreductase subunit beta [Bacillota bacterium]